MKSISIIKLRLQNEINSLATKRDCIHRWERFGFGFHCVVCDYYTGMWKRANDAIKREQKKAKP